MATVLQATEDPFELACKHSFCPVYHHLVNDRMKIVEKVLHGTNLPNHRVERVPHLMTDGGINQLLKVFIIFNFLDHHIL